MSNSEVIAKTVHEYASAQGVQLVVRLATMEDALPVARDLLDNGTDVILGGGGTGRLLRQQLRRPAVTISRTHLDIIRALRKVGPAARYIAITSYCEATEGLDVLSEMMGVRLRPVVFSSSQELTESIARAVDDGVDCVVGGGVCVDIAGALGCRGFVVTPGPRAIQQAFDEAHNIAESQYRDRKQAAWLSGALDSLHEGIIGVDRNGEILISNAKAAEFLGATPDNRRTVYGDFLESARMGSVLKSGNAIPDSISTFGECSIVSNIRPIRINNEVEGALAAFRPAAYLRSMGDKLRRYDKSRGFAAKYTFADLTGNSESMRALRQRAERFAQTDVNIFIQGETGAGKELLAHAVHTAGPRSNEPFVAVNCAALPDSLLESELFGYEEGAFTGARKGGKEGLFLLANRGSIFLDEIADISPLLQVRLLRVLESQEILQVGGVRVIPISVRVLSSTWKNLAQEVREGRFRADLYYRLNTLSLHLPPLRDRPKDIPAICTVLLRRSGLAPEIFSARGHEMLAAYPWPGNIRELDALVRRYALLNLRGEPDDMLLAELLQELADTSGSMLGGPQTQVYGAQPSSSPASGIQGEFVREMSLKRQVERYERELIRQAVLRNGQSKKLAARQLDISENTLWRKLKGE